MRIGFARGDAPALARVRVSRVAHDARKRMSHIRIGAQHATS